MQQTFLTVLQFFRDIQNQLFSFLPAQAGIGDGLAEDMLISLLGTVFQITFDHQSLDQPLNGGVLVAAVDDILGDTDLFQILLAGIVVIGVYDDRRLSQTGMFIQAVYPQQIFVVIIGGASSGIIDIAS